MAPVTRPARITSTDVEHKVQLQRILDVQRTQLESFSVENNKLLAEARSQAKIEIKRRQADQQSCKTEMEYERKMKDGHREFTTPVIHVDGVARGSFKLVNS